MSGLVLVHGGAGAMRSMGGAQEAAYRAGLAEAARLGREALRGGADALAAVMAATRHLEACGAFNAGAGACLDEDGKATLDAALMRGSDRGAGAVACLTATRHPSDVCLDLLQEGRHVLLVGEGADRRARRLGLPPLPPPGEDRLATWNRLKAERAAGQAQDLSSVGRPDHEDARDTVGVVVLDGEGRLAASVTTGGMWLKTAGRVGDSAGLGAGVYACDGLGAAASTTGIGERFLRCVTARLACDRVSQGRNAAEAAREALDDLEARFGRDTGGLIVVDRGGGVGVAFDTDGMGRALARTDREAIPVAVWPDEAFPTR